MTMFHLTASEVIVPLFLRLGNWDTKKGRVPRVSACFFRSAQTFRKWFWLDFMNWMVYDGFYLKCIIPSNLKHPT